MDLNNSCHNQKIITATLASIINLKRSKQTNRSGQSIIGKDIREKGIRWMPWHRMAMKGVANCDKPRVAVSMR